MPFPLLRNINIRADVHVLRQGPAFAFHSPAPLQEQGSRDTTCNLVVCNKDLSGKLALGRRCALGSTTAAAAGVAYVWSSQTGNQEFDAVDFAL